MNVVSRYTDSMLILHVASGLSRLIGRVVLAIKRLELWSVDVFLFPLELCKHF